ncbi:MAG: epoxyqueuosine reductase QueH [Bacilli bacterium]|nr:epoxyqueuosine reductase QueH [Bacilli bacterium]
MNYQLKLEEIIEKNKDNKKIPTLLLHSCCAPCSSYCLEYLSNFFKITIFYYNPNITEKEEYLKRVVEQKRLIKELPCKYEIKFLEGNYNPKLFFNLSKGLEREPEKGKRCFKCYELRLQETALIAKKLDFDYFATTLTLSPYKNSNWVNEIGEKLETKYNIKYLYSDFKKKNGYKRSIELSKIYNLYRQDYCGCIYSKKNKAKD